MKMSVPGDTCSCSINLPSRPTMGLLSGNTQCFVARRTPDGTGPSSRRISCTTRSRYGRLFSVSLIISEVGSHSLARTLFDAFDFLPQLGLYVLVQCEAVQTKCKRIGRRLVSRHDLSQRRMRWFSQMYISGPAPPGHSCAARRALGPCLPSR